MKFLRTENRYGSGDGPIINPKFDYLLFKQDWGGNESIYFNEGEIPALLTGIGYGSVLIDKDETVVYSKSDDLLKKIDGLFNCRYLVK